MRLAEEREPRRGQETSETPRLSLPARLSPELHEGKTCHFSSLCVLPLLNSQCEDRVCRNLGSSILVEVTVGRRDSVRQRIKGKKPQQGSEAKRREGGRGERRRAKHRTNLMDKEDAGAREDANSDHSPDGSIHTCKRGEER